MKALMNITGTPSQPLRKSQGEKLREKYLGTISGRTGLDQREARLSATLVGGKKVPIVFEQNLSHPKRFITA